MKGQGAAVRTLDQLRELHDGERCPECGELLEAEPDWRSETHYSGDLSRDFWDRVKATQETSWAEWDALYDMGCDLQNLEEKVLSRCGELLGESRVKRPRRCSDCRGAS